MRRWTATVNESASNAVSVKTTRQNWLELAETLPPLAFTNAIGYRLQSRSDEQRMKTRFILFRRDNGVFYTEDTTSGKQSSLRTIDETEAKSLLNAKNEAQRQPVLNLHLSPPALHPTSPNRLKFAVPSANLRRTTSRRTRRKQERDPPLPFYVAPDRQIAYKINCVGRTHDARRQFAHVRVETFNDTSYGSKIDR